MPRLAAPDACLVWGLGCREGSPSAACATRADLVLGGYTRGKAMAEEALRKHYPEGGVAIRPGVVYGNRCVV